MVHDISILIRGILGAARYTSASCNVEYVSRTFYVSATMQVCAHRIIKGPHHILDILTGDDPHGPMPFSYDNPIQPHLVLGTISSQNIPWLSPVLNILRPFVCGRTVEISAESAQCIRTLDLWGECDAMSTSFYPVKLSSRVPRG